MNTSRGLPRAWSRGFISLGIALVIAIVAAAVLGGAGWWVSHRFNDEQNSITIIFPTAGDMLFAEKKTVVHWSIPRATLDSFPSDFDTNIFLYVQRQGDPEGVNVSGIGDGHAASTDSAGWDIPAQISSGKLTPGTYKIVAQFQALPKDEARLCAIAVNKDCSPNAADAAIIARGSPIKGESGWFAIKYDEESTANWKIYRNEKFSFEFMYPPEFTLEEGSGANPEIGDDWTTVTVRNEVNGFNLTFFAGRRSAGGPGKGYTDLETKTVTVAGKEAQEILLTSNEDPSAQVLLIIRLRPENNRFDQIYSSFTQAQTDTFVPQVESIVATFRYLK